ncbi:MAG: polysaccharide biosynthesis C-terminal domain-containing protein [Erysipelotrichaceae bacterium]|nr:polysaccharide biosynthesis C-terminal domain-containing protein [Erysipelotrichaceae bacterium]
MKKSRTQRALLSVATSLMSEGVALICGLVVPQMILTTYGSVYNGITQSITQFISYISLMKAGIGGATAVALYKPLAENNTQEISEVLASTEKFMRKISLIFILFIASLSIIYPTFIVKEYDWWFTASLIFIIAISTFGQYYFGFTYQTLLAADQKDYITGTLDIITTIMNTIVAIILINNNFSLHIVKLGSSLVHLFTPLFLYFYCRKKYHIISRIKPSEDRIPQKWDAAAHEVASFVNNNTDVVILTLFATIPEVSVYTVYHYVIANLKKIVTKFTIGFGSAFGDMYARNEIELMHTNLSIFELIIYSFTSVLYSVTLVMMLPFVAIYTRKVTDIEYIRPLFSFLLILGGVFNCFRVPYRVITIAAGHYKQTRNGAITEAVLNIVVSVVGVILFGLIGVALGSLVAMAFRTLQYVIYLSNNIMYRDIRYFMKHAFLCFAIMVAVYFIAQLYIPATMDSWLTWILYASVTTIIAMILTLVTDYIFYKEDLFNFINKLKRNFLSRFLKKKEA